MKKLLALILVLALAMPAVSLAEFDIMSLLDLSTMTDEALRGMINLCSAELMTRHKVDPDGILILDQDNVRVYQTGDAYISYGFLRIPVAIVNDNDFEAWVGPDDAKCNGWDIYSSGDSASGKGKKKGNLAFNLSDAEIESIDQIESLEFKWSISNFDKFVSVYKDAEREEHRFW